MLEGKAAAGTAYAVPAAGLKPGKTYHWYVTPRDRDGRWAYAPVEGIFAVARVKGRAGSSSRGGDSVSGRVDRGSGKRGSAEPGGADSPRLDPRRRLRAGGL